MGDIIEFPSQGIQFDNLSGEFCLKVSSDNPLLTQGLKETSNDIHTLFKTVNSSCPTFFFKSIGDSIRDNDATLRSAVLKLTDEYNKIIKDLVIQIEVNSGDTLLISEIRYSNNRNEYSKPQKGVSILKVQ